MIARRLASLVGGLVIVVAACAPAAAPTPTPTPAATPRAAPTATPSPVPRAAATPTPAPTPTLAGPRKGGVLRAAIFADVPGWDPFRFQGTDLHHIIQFVHTRLILQNFSEPGCELYPMEPELATSWTWRDDRTLELKLRQGVKFQDLPPMNGRELVAEDVVFSITEQWSKMSWYREITQAVKSVEARDKYTVRINLLKPFAVFVDKALWSDLANIVGPEIFEGKKELVRREQNVGLGPFVLTDYITGVRATLKRNPNYSTIRPGVPYLDGLDLIVIPDPSSQMATLRAGKVDYLYTGYNPPTIDGVRRIMPQLQGKICAFQPMPGITMRADKPPFNDVRVRWALSMAIDREALNKTVYLGMGIPSYTGVTPLFGPYHLPLQKVPPELRRYVEYRPEDAKKLLAEAGYPTGFKTDIIYTPAYGSVQKGIAESMVDFLARIGITAKLNVMDYRLFLETVNVGGNYEGMSVKWLGPGSDPDTPTWDYLHSGSTVRNQSHVNDPRWDQLLEASRAATDAQERYKVYHEMQRYWLQTMYYIHFPLLPTAAFWYPYVKGVNFKSYSKNYKDFLMFAWLDK